MVFHPTRVHIGTDHAAYELKEYLVTQHGVLIRDAANFRSLSPRHFRLSVQSPEAGQALLRGLSSYL